MIIMNKIQKEDIQDFARSFELANFLSNSNFLITGATGLVGSTLVRCLLALEKGIGITCPVRNIDKAHLMYGDDFGKICFVE